MKTKNLILAIAIPNIIGILGAIIGNPSTFNEILKPSFTPPSQIFSIVWPILYTLMGISSYLIFKSNDKYKNKALSIYIIQLVLNFLWNFIFFNQQNYLLAFSWIIILIVVVIYMIYEFFKINKTAAYLQIPYLLWLIFASILSYNIYLLN